MSGIVKNKDEIKFEELDLNTRIYVMNTAHYGYLRLLSLEILKYP